MADVSPSLESGCCHRCNSEYMCPIIAEHEHSYFAFEWEGDEVDKYYILKCPKCSSIIFKHKHYLSFGELEPFDEDSISEECFPKYRRKFSSDVYLSGLSVLTNKKFKMLLALMLEIGLAIDNDQFILAAMGVRTLLDVTCKMLIGNNDNNFTKNIKLCIEEGYISKKHLEILNSALELGHAAVHRCIIPNKYDVIMSYKIVLNLIDTHICHSKIAKRITKKIPKRPKQ